MDDFAHYARRGRFAFSQPPIPGESLVGFVARNADIHGVEKVSTALKPAGVYTARVGFLPFSNDVDAEGLAYVFGAPEKEILARRYKAVDLEDRPKNAFVDFFGAPVRSAYIETRVRRVSPTALRAKEFHRAVWDLRPFVFCTETGERLIDTCPACGASLAWTWTCGPTLCEHCRADLREHPQPVVDGFDDPHLRLVASLVDPVVDRRRHPVRLGGCFGDATRGDVFEFCMSLARTIDAVRAGAAAKTYAHAHARIRKEHAPILPTDLAFAGGIVSEWKLTGLAPLIKIAMAATEERGGAWGASEEFRHVRNLARDPFLHRSIRDACAAALAKSTSGRPAPVRCRRFRDVGTLVTAREAAKYGISRKMIRLWRADGLISPATNPAVKASVVVMRRDEIEKIAAERDAAVDRATVAKKLGVDSATVVRFAALGMIEHVGRPAADMLVTEHYRGTGVDAVVKSIETLAAQPDRLIVPLLDAAATAKGDEDKLLASALVAGLAGALPLYRLAVGSDGAVGRLAVAADVDLGAFLIDAPPSAYEGVRFGVRDARQYLKASLNTITALIAEGELRDNGRHKEKLDFVDVEAFRRRYALTNEIAGRLGIHPAAVVSQLKARGLAPERVLTDGTILWDRKALKPFVAN